MAHENSLQALKKECRRLETLTSQVVCKEKALLQRLRTTEEFQRMSVGGEHRALLAKDDAAEGRLEGSSGGYEEDKSREKSGDMAFLGEFVIKQQEALEKERQDKIHEVCDSLQNVWFSHRKTTDVDQ